jgi:hypothetical protein
MRRYQDGTVLSFRQHLEFCSMCEVLIVQSLASLAALVLIQETIRLNRTMFRRIISISYQKTAPDEATLLHDEASFSPPFPRLLSDTLREDAIQSERTPFSTQKHTLLTWIAFVANHTLFYGNMGIGAATLVQDARLAKYCPDLPPCKAPEVLASRVIVIDGEQLP